ncbi:MAG TPA: UTP--glucose-1-phosphate uridylyltransferase [Chlamydiales bacterium]|nr:UTP--glucose-1-phosphate uridylyltransferase [Chlamydiales bacterium]
MLELLSEQFTSSFSVHEKISALDPLPALEKFLAKYPFLRLLLAGLSPECEVALKQTIAIGQGECLFSGITESNFDAERFRELIEKLVAIDHFYREIGGIVGYQKTILQLLRGPSEVDVSPAHYHSPSFIDISEETASVKEAIAWGIESLPEIAEIYPLGGAADRLHLIEEKTGQELPAAKLIFAGKTLLEHLIRDLEARELLYFQKTGQRVTTPIAIMTSHEKNNHNHVIQICEELNWFGRPRDSIRLFTQPLVPVVNEKGDWCLAGPLKPLLKPGGHGAIWKLAQDEGIFVWLEKQGRKKALIRQINNPIAGLDYGLLAFTGIGCKKEMIFGFASCPRLLQAAEGVNVLIERGKEIVLTNIEYCDFAKFGIEDRPLKEGEPYSRFSSNTNILFADLEAISKAVDECPFPGLLINLKKGSYTTEWGEKKEELMARLESTMQNIADVFVEEKGETLKTNRTFVTYNRRHKTISTAKKAFVAGRSMQETPENCFFDLLTANRELLIECGFQLPPKRTLEEYLQKGPEFLLLYHPALGPLYSSIREKIKGGKLSLGSELLLEIADFRAVDLAVCGSLQVYSDRTGQCILENVTIENRGIRWEHSAPFWKMELDRSESIKIILKGQSRFIARNVCLKGNQTFIVEDGKELQIK